MLCVSGLWEKPTSTQTQHSNTAPHYTRLMTVFVVVVIIASECIFFIIFFLNFLYVFLCVFFLQVNVDVLFLVYKRNRVEMLRLTLILCALIQSVK